MKVGQKFQHNFLVDENVYKGFIDLFKDNNDLHVDSDYAKIKGFKSKVMHGNILNGFVSYFVGELLPKRNVIIHSQSTKFYKPVYLNDDLIFEAEIKGVHESVNVVKIDYSFKNSGEQVASGKVQIGLI